MAGVALTSVIVPATATLLVSILLLVFKFRYCRLVHTISIHSMASTMSRTGLTLGSRRRK